MEKTGCGLEIKDFQENTFLFDAYPDLLPKDGLKTVAEWIRRDNAKSNLNDQSDRLDRKLLYGGVIAAKILKSLFEETGYYASVGVASNKIMAKIAAGVMKPKAVAIALPSGFQSFCQAVKIENIKGFGGSKGEAIIKTLEMSTMHDLQNFSSATISGFMVDGAPIGHNEAFKLVMAVNGFCLDPVKHKVFFNSFPITRKLPGLEQHCQRRDIKKIIQDQVCEMIERAREEVARNGTERWPESVKVSVVFKYKTRHFKMVVLPSKNLDSKIHDVMMNSWPNSDCWSYWPNCKDRRNVYEVNMMPIFATRSRPRRG